MENIGKKILVMSGKGGVGKSTIAVNFAAWLSSKNKTVGLLDIDIHGPSIPKMLNIENRRIFVGKNNMNPVPYRENFEVMSIGFMLPDDGSPVIWRGPMKHNLIKQFITDVNWGNLDYLVIDCPPGTGDEALSIIQLFGNIDGVIIVTTPQQLSVIDVKKCISFCKQLNVSILGVIENMSGFICPHCKNSVDIFKSEGGRQISEQYDVPFLGKIPLNSDVVSACDSGNPIVIYDKESSLAKAFNSAFEPVIITSQQKQNDMETQLT